MSAHKEARAAAQAFAAGGTLKAIAIHGNGHINDSYLAVFERRGVRKRFLLQKINTRIFSDPAALIENIERVTTHIARQSAPAPEESRRVLTLARTEEGSALHIGPDGGAWRMFEFIEGARSSGVAGNAAQAYEAARAIGRFQVLLAGLPPPRLNEILPGFHNTPERMSALRQAIACDSLARAEGAREEIEHALSREADAGLLLRAGLPERITHNDAKLDNVLLDERTGKGVCVIDLETTMPGLAPFDFGDMARTMCCPTAEDERDLRKVRLDLRMFAAVAQGYLSTARELLTDGERRMLAAAARVIALEQAIRFLTDHLTGDRYFKVHRPGHNLDRARVQLRLLHLFEDHEPDMERVLQEFKERTIARP